MKNILTFCIFLAFTTSSYALYGPVDCSVYTYGQDKKENLLSFLSNVKQLVKQYECNNKRLQETEATAVCTHCSSHGVFTKVVSWIAQQQDNLFPCKHTDIETLKNDLSKIVNFPLSVIFHKGMSKKISSIEEFYDEFPRIFNADILESVKNSESIFCSPSMIHIEETFFIRKDENQQLKIFMIKTPY